MKISDIEVGEHYLMTGGRYISGRIVRVEDIRRGGRGSLPRVITREIRDSGRPSEFTDDFPPYQIGRKVDVEEELGQRRERERLHQEHQARVSAAVDTLTDALESVGIHEKARESTRSGAISLSLSPESAMTLAAAIYVAAAQQGRNPA